MKKTKLELTNDELAALDLAIKVAKGALAWDTAGQRSVELKVVEAYVATMPRKHYAERAMNE